MEDVRTQDEAQATPQGRTEAQAQLQAQAEPTSQPQPPSGIPAGTEAQQAGQQQAPPQTRAVTPRRQGLVNVYVAAIILLAAVAFAWSAVNSPFTFNLQFVLFCLGALLLAPRSIPLGGRVEMLASEPFLFGALLAVGALESVVIAGLCALTFCLMRNRRLPLHRVLFNIASLSLTMFAAAHVYLLAGGQVAEHLSLESSLLPVMAAVLVFFLVNASTVSTAIGISEGISPLFVLRKKFVWSYPSHLASGSVAFIMAVALQQYGFYAIALAVPPCLLIYYFQRGQKERVEEHERHLEEVRTINTDLEAQARELAMVNERLEVASRMKSEFMANMSHELRTPLAAILGFSDLLLNKDVCRLEEEPESWVQDIRKSGHHLLEMINDILNLSKIDAGHMSLKLETVEIATLIQEVVKTIRPLAERNGLLLSTSTPLLDEAGGLLKVRVDPTKIRQVLYNLLSNAIKFTPGGGRVLVACTRDGRNLELVVSDTGIGIDPEDHDRVFAKFMQVDSSMSRRYEGTGLGLALVKKFAGMHGGRVQLISRLGEGATFEVYLPDCCLLPEIREDDPVVTMTDADDGCGTAADDSVATAPPAISEQARPESQ
jgi:signal transduction histidine kinase